MAIRQGDGDGYGDGEGDGVPCFKEIRFICNSPRFRKIHPWPVDRDNTSAEADPRHQYVVTTNNLDVCVCVKCNSNLICMRLCIACDNCC